MHAVVFTNAEQARNLFAVAAKLGKDAIAENCAQPHAGRLDRPGGLGRAARAAVNVGLESKPPKLGALMSALDSALS